MNDNEMNNMFEQLGQMFKNNEFPDDIKNLLNNVKNSSNDSNSSENSNDTNIDINTILKMKKIMDSMNSNKDDPRSNLLLSLKPYLKESRRKKVDQYIQLFGIGKAFEIMNSLGGENSNDK